MTLLGYARVSTTDQDLSIQEAKLRAAGCQIIRAEKRSGANPQRTQRAAGAARVSPARRHAGRHQDRPPGTIDEGPAGHHPRAEGEGGHAQGHRPADRHRLRRRQGVPRHAGRVRRVRDQPAPRAPARGHRCRQGPRRLQGPQTVDRPAKVRQLAAKGVGGTEIARALGIGRASVYRLLRQRPPRSSEGPH